MSKEVALSLADADNPETISRRMELANEYFKQIDPHSWETVFKSSDIQLCKFYEQAELTLRERDMIYITSFLHPCYSDLHTTVLTLGEPLSPSSVDTLDKLFTMLQKYNLTNILLDDKITDDEFIKIMVELK
jgi:hypothetical protein